MIDTNVRIQQLMSEKKWSKYRLASEAQLPQSTIANIFSRNTVPSIPILNAICVAFDITLAQFFAVDNFVELTTEQAEMFDRWATLSPAQKSLINDLIGNFK